jgi:hypothetical protein
MSPSKPQGGKVPYDEAAAQAVGQVQTEGPDAGESLAAMSTDRPERLPAEDEHDRLMAEFKAMSERMQAMEAELAGAKSGYAAAVAALGPPEVAVYGAAISAKLESFKAANPDVPPGHFDQVIAAVGPLAASSAEVIGGGGDVDTVKGHVPDAVAAVEKFIGKTHPRMSGKPLDFSALEADLEYAQAAAE